MSNKELFNKYKYTIKLILDKYYKDYSFCREDLTQEASIALYKAVKKFNPEKNVNFSTYCIIHIKFALQNYIKTKITKHEKLLDLSDFDFENIPDNYKSNNDLVLDINSLLNRFSYRTRSILEMYYLNDVSMPEIGKIVGLSKQRVSIIINSALIRLRNLSKRLDK